MAIAETGLRNDTQLNIQYETFLDHQFIKLLEEYGLHDLAKLKVENKKSLTGCAKEDAEPYFIETNSRFQFVMSL